MTDVFVREITDGIGDTGVRAGVIKVATGAGRVTPYEEVVLRAAARAHRRPACRSPPTPTRARWVPSSSTSSSAEGVAPSSVDHRALAAERATCRTTCACSIAAPTSGFDRFGLELLHPDRERLAVLIGLLGIGFERQLVLSHDTVWCWRGRAPTLPPETLPLWEPTYVLRTVVPRLRDAGVAEAKIEAMLVDNPRRYFAEAGTTTC